MNHMTTAPILRLVLLSVVGSLLQPPTLEERIARVTGPNPVDCGRFSMLHNGVALPIRPSSKAKTRDDSMRESLACAEQALKDGKGFKVVQFGGAHGALYTGVLGTAEGRTFWFHSINSDELATKPCPLTDVTIEISDNGNRVRLLKCGRWHPVDDPMRVSGELARDW